MWGRTGRFAWGPTVARACNPAWLSRLPALSERNTNDVGSSNNEFAQTQPKGKSHNKAHHSSSARRIRHGRGGGLVAGDNAAVPKQALFLDAAGERSDARGRDAVRYHAARRRQPVPPPSRRPMDGGPGGRSHLHHQGPTAAGAEGRRQQSRSARNDPPPAESHRQTRALY